jgi:catecholate siderophore receptor
VGDRSALSPVHSGTVWSTYQLTPQFRFGGGINFRSAQMPLNQAWEAPAYSTIDLMAEYKIDSRWALKANLTNAGDVYYAADLYQGHYVPGAGPVDTPIDHEGLSHGLAHQAALPSGLFLI